VGTRPFDASLRAVEQVPVPPRCSDDAYKALIARIMEFYTTALFNPHWGEQIVFRPGNLLAINMLFQGIDQEQAEVAWRPFLDWLAEGNQDFQLSADPFFISAPARHFWDPRFLEKVPGIVLFDTRPGAWADNMFWAGNLEEAGQVLHGYQSAWLPASLLERDRREALAEMLFAASRHWSISLHTNKGLAGAPAEVVEQARDTAINPAALEAFALLISAAKGPPAYPGIPGHEPGAVKADRDVEAIGRAMSEVRRLVPNPGSYVAESDFFEERWQDAFWGTNYPRLLAAKERYDPDGLFINHHGVGSERWSADGFTRLSGRHARRSLPPDRLRSSRRHRDRYQFNQPAWPCSPDPDRKESDMGSIRDADRRCEI
jgi:hypothetical protein